MGICTSNDGESMFAPGSSGSSVGVYETSDGGDSLKYDAGVGATAGAAILMAGAVRDESSTKGTLSVLVGGLWGAALSGDAGASWAKLNANPIITQGIKYESGSGYFSMVGVSLGKGVLMVSGDGGASFGTLPVTGLFENEDVRYGSCPTASTCYVTAGLWGSSSASDKRHRLTSRFAIGAKGELLVGEPGPRAAVVGPDGSKRAPQGYNETGYWGQVAKTSDGGATWSLVLDDFESDQYPNDISCFDEATCVVVFEGLGAPRALSTTDGGATWTTFTAADSGATSLMTALMVGPTEAYVAGGGLVGTVWHTTDLATWTASTTLATDAATLLSFTLNANGEVAYATGALRSQLMSILKLEF